MCGIIYAKNLSGNEPVNSLVKILYQNQKDRGGEGFGFVGMDAKRINTYRATQEKDIIRFLNENQYSEILFHHRRPTSTRNTIKSTHPFVIRFDGQSYYFVHNGIVQNADDLQEGHIKRDITYKSQEQGVFNDSEALAWDFCLWIKGQQERMKAKGAVAFICLETDEKNRALKLYFYRNGLAPLRLYRDRDLLAISSEGGYPALKEDTLYFWDYQRGQVLEKGSLKIASESIHDYYMCEDTDYEAILRDEIEALKQERDYLICSGRYDDADYIQEEIEDLSNQLKGRI